MEELAFTDAIIVVFPDMPTTIRHRAHDMSAVIIFLEVEEGGNGGP